MPRSHTLAQSLTLCSGCLNHGVHLPLQRAEMLINAHERFRKVLGGKRLKVVEPVLPMDVLGVYILLPENQR
jgi:hypothetical protein